jgi:hypothetical protein
VQAAVLNVKEEDDDDDEENPVDDLSRLPGIQFTAASPAKGKGKARGGSRGGGPSTSGIGRGSKGGGRRRK